MNGELFTQIILGVITIISALVSAFVIPWLKSKIATEEIDKLSWFVTCAVRAANQMFTPEQWKEKKSYVFSFVRGFLDNNLSITLTDSQLDAIIEGIVNEVKHENK